jgi:hypothetical protein
MTDIAKKIKNIGQDTEAKPKTSKAHAEGKIFLLEFILQNG